jgi:hypothetical protein
MFFDFRILLSPENVIFIGAPEFDNQKISKFRLILWNPFKFHSEDDPYASGKGRCRYSKNGICFIFSTNGMII